MSGCTSTKTVCTLTSVDHICGVSCMAAAAVHQHPGGFINPVQMRKKHAYAHTHARTHAYAHTHSMEGVAGSTDTAAGAEASAVRVAATILYILPESRP